MSYLSRSSWERIGTWLAPGELAPYTVSMEVDIDLIERLSHTQGFDIAEVVVTRRGTTFPVTLKTRSRLTIDSATLIYDEKKSVTLAVEKQTSRVYGTVVEVSYIIIMLLSRYGALKLMQMMDII